MDERLFELINRQWTSPGLDRLMAAVSSFDAWVPFLIAICVAAAVFGRRRARVFLAVLAIMLLGGEGLLDRPLKHWIHRPRPYQVMAEVRQVDLARHVSPRMLAVLQPVSVTISRDPQLPNAAAPAAGRSFPSSHVVNNFCAAVTLTFLYRWGWLYFSPALLVGYSRVYVGAHWPSDVVLSACLATGYAFCFLALMQALIARFRPALWQQIGGRP